MNKQRIGLVLAFASATLAMSGVSIAEDEAKPAAEKAPASKPPGANPPGAPAAGPHGGMMKAGPGGPTRVGPDGKPLMFKGPPGMGPHGMGGPGFDERNKQLKERIEKLKKEGKADQAAQLEKMLANGPGANPRPPMTPEEIQKRRQTRKFARIRMMNRRYGAALQRPELVKDIAVHARRTARLSRLRTLIQAQPESPERDKRLQRINQLMGLENSRHNKHMADLAPESVRGTANANSLAPNRPVPAPAADPAGKADKEEAK